MEYFTGILHVQTVVPDPFLLPKAVSNNIEEGLRLGNMQLTCTLSQETCAVGVAYWDGNASCTSGDSRDSAMDEDSGEGGAGQGGGGQQQRGVERVWELGQEV